MILLCWEPGQETPIHCHNDQECWVYVLKGEFDEKRYSENSSGPKLEVEQSCCKDGVSYMKDEMGFHKLINSTNGRAMSLHLYVKPIEACNVYNELSEKFEEKQLTYYSYEGIALKKETA